MDPFTIKCVNGGQRERGARHDGGGVHFAVYSEHAHKIELCLFDAAGAETRLSLPGHDGHVFHGYVPGLAPGQLYGFRAHGPFDPAAGLRFDAEKILVDPYAREIAQDGLSPKGRVTGAMDPPEPLAARRKAEDLVICELHPKGQTMTDPAVPEALRGRIAGLAHPAALGRLSALGVNALELLPVHAKADEPRLAALGLSNYWGYSTLGFFAPETSYLSTGRREEFRDMVTAAHRAGFEVILDVVYNHTAEGGAGGPTLSLKGLDNKAYYRLDRNGGYIDETGCGNTLDISHPEARRLVLDSLRYWAGEMGVDGFRFDLATVLGRGPHGFSPSAPFFREIAADPLLSKCRMIAEPWSPAEYQSGRFPPGWAEWNDGFRDDVRKFWRGNSGMDGAMAMRLSGSHPLLGGRPPAESVNFVTCHDGMTLHDLVSHGYKKNLANGEGNRDGADANHSCNHGAEGETGEATVNALRLRQKRNFLSTLFLAHGTPMLLSGDEHGNTQGGNNNAYCQDNPVGWLDWRRGEEAEGRALSAFTGALAAFRAAHPALRREAHLHGGASCAHGVRDMTWIAPSGRERTEWSGPDSGCFGMLLNEGAMLNAGGSRLLAVFNARSAPAPFTLPVLPCGPGWEKVLDTADPGGAPSAAGASVVMPEKSVAVFRLRGA